MKCSEVNWDGWADLLDESSGHPIDLVFRIVFSRYEQARDLCPDARLVVQVQERVQYRPEMCGADSVIEVLRETLQVHVRSIHVLEEFFASFFRDIAGGHSHTFYSYLVASLRGVHGVFQEKGAVTGAERLSAASFLILARWRCRLNMNGSL